MSNYKIKFTSSDVTADPLSAIKTPFTVLEGTKNTTDTSLALCGHNYPNYGELLWTNMVHLLENFASMAEPDASTIGQLWYDSSEGKLKIYKGSGVGEGYQYIAGDDTTLFNADTFDAMLRTFNASQHATPYFDNRYIQITGGTGIGTLELEPGSNIVVQGDGMIKVDAAPTNEKDVVNRKYLVDVFAAIGYNIDDLNAITSLYLPLTGGTMDTAAVIKVPKSIEIWSPPTQQNHAITKSYAEDHFVSFGVNKTPIQEITMGGPLYVSEDICDNPTDLEAVSARWVRGQISKFGGTIGAGVYIPIKDTKTTVTNNLEFTKNNWITVDIDANNWGDQKLVLNQERANTLYVKRAGDTLTAHPTVTTSTTALDVPTCGWVNSRIAAAGGGGSSGPTVTKLSTYGPVVSIPVRNGYPTSPDSTITLTIPSNTVAVDYEIRFGAFISVNTKNGNPGPAKFIVKADTVQVYTVSLIQGLGGISAAMGPSDEVHSFKYTSTAGASHTITVEIYGMNSTAGSNYLSGVYSLNGWVIADPLSATVAIAASTQTTGGVTPGPAGSVTYVDFGNGMVMISGITQTTVKNVNTGLAKGNSVYVGTDITFPNNIKLKIPYTLTATHMMEPGVAKSSYYHNETWDTSNMITTKVTQSGCTVDWMVALVTSLYTAALKSYYATPRDVHWTVTGFKA